MAAKKKQALPPTATETHHAPSVRVFTELTPASIRSARLSAEQGYLLPAVQICEWLLADDRVAAVLDARLDALMGLEPDFEAGTSAREQAALDALDEQDDWCASYPEHFQRALLRWGILLGVAPGRHGWTESPDHGGRVLPNPAFWHPQGLRWDWVTRRWLARDANGVELEIVPGNGEWILHTPGGLDRPWSTGLWSSLAMWVLLKHYAIGDWGRHSEKGSLRVVTDSKGASKETRAELAKMLRESGADAVVALPLGFDMKLLEVTANTKAIYEAQINAADQAIAIRIRGGNLTTQVSDVGSKAAADTQAKTGDGAKLKSDAAALSTTLHDQSLVWWADFNFGDRKLAPWPCWPVEPEEDKSQRATMISTLADGLAKLDALGFEIDTAAVQEEFGLSFITGRKEPDPPDPQNDPNAQPAPAPDPNDDENGNDENGNDTNARASKRSVRLASGMPVAAASGFVDGQDYVDSIVESGTAEASSLLASDLARVLALVDSVQSYDELSAKLAELYPGLDPERLAGSVERFLILADLAGRAAVMQDV